MRWSRFIPAILAGLIFFPAVVRSQSALSQLEQAAGRSISSVNVPTPSAPTAIGALGSVAGSAGALSSGSISNAVAGMVFQSLLNNLFSPAPAKTPEQIEAERLEQERLEMEAEKIRLEEEARQSVLRLQSHSKDAKAFYEAGLIPKNDMLQSEVELAQGEQNLVDAENASAMAKSRLNVLMERPVGSFLSIKESDEYVIQDILEVGQRAQTLSRLFNLREGFTAEDDRLPKRVMQAFTQGPLAGVEIKPETFEWAKKRFYEMMFWDRDTGIPNRVSLQKLQLIGLLDGII